MEKTGVQFTEKAWKDFLDFLKDVKSPGGTEEQETDQFVEAYYKQQKAAEPQKHRGAEKLEKLYSDIYEIMHHTGGEYISIPEIIEQLKPYGHYDINSKGFSATMNSVMAKNPEIYRAKRGAYGFDHEYVDDSVDILFVEGDTSDEQAD